MKECINGMIVELTAKEEQAIIDDAKVASLEKQRPFTEAIICY